MNHRFPHTTIIVFALAAILGGPAVAGADEMHHTVVRAGDVKWGPAPPFLPPGAKAAVLAGDPGKPGMFVLRLDFPAGYVIPPHRHSQDELVTVLSGAVVINGGEHLDAKPPAPETPGTFVNLPAGMPHYARAVARSVVQINGTGPFDITYVRAQDDPRNAKVSAR